MEDGQDCAGQCPFVPVCVRARALGEVCTMRVCLRWFPGKAGMRGLKGATVCRPNIHFQCLSFPIRTVVGWFLTERPASVNGWELGSGHFHGGLPPKACIGPGREGTGLGEHTPGCKVGHLGLGPSDLAPCPSRRGPREGGCWRWAHARDRRLRQTSPGRPAQWGTSEPILGMLGLCESPGPGRGLCLLLWVQFSPLCRWRH